MELDIDFLIKVIKDSIRSKHNDKNIEEAKYWTSIYTGKDQEEIVNKYRKLESKNQKEQRNRVTISRTKHVAKQIERCFNHLRTLDKSAKVIEGKDEDIRKLSEYIYNNNLEKLAFEYVLYYNQTDANAFLIASVDEFDEIVFTPVKSKNIINYKVVNDNLKYLIIKRDVTINKKVVTSYSMFTNNMVVNLENKETGKLESDQAVTIKGNTYYVSSFSTSHCYAFRLGYTKNVDTDFETCTTILDPASELFRSLIWEGSELDIIKLTHGIVQKFAYAPKCNYSIEDDNGYRACSDGRLGDTTCPKCKGSGMKIHHSSQDIVFLEEPLDNESRVPLDQQIHVEYIPDSILQYRTQELKDLEEKIYKTVFSSNYLTKSEISATATEKRIDQQGLYSALGQMGAHVSDCFIWMCETVIDINEWKGVQVSHGYSLDFKLDTVDSLIEMRTKAVAAGVPIDVIHVIDYAIQSKQHVDNPKAIDRIAFWESFKPFTDKTESERMQILASLSSTDPIKVLWNYFGTIRQNILRSKDGDKFYDLTAEKQKERIDSEVQLIIDTIKSNQSIVTDFSTV